MFFLYAKKLTTNVQIVSRAKDQLVDKLTKCKQQNKTLSLEVANLKKTIAEHSFSSPLNDHHSVQPATKHKLQEDSLQPAVTKIVTNTQQADQKQAHQQQTVTLSEPEQQPPEPQQSLSVEREPEVSAQSNAGSAEQEVAESQSPQAPNSTGNALFAFGKKKKPWEK
jgi:hypothetical protein